MAATVQYNLNPGDKTYLAADAIGTGAPATTDLLYTDTVTYPIGSRYFDTASFIEYRRVATTLAATDWVASAAMTAL